MHVIYKVLYVSISWTLVDKIIGREDILYIWIPHFSLT